jgi:hypothetical protein
MSIKSKIMAFVNEKTGKLLETIAEMAENAGLIPEI